MMASFSFRQGSLIQEYNKPILDMQAHPQTIHQVVQKLGAHSKSFKKTVCVIGPYHLVIFYCLKECIL